jgi:hypothetical protein
MACEPKFPEDIPLDCALEIVRSIMAGGVPGDGSLAVKACWVVGSLIQKFGSPLVDDGVGTLNADSLETTERNLAYSETVAAIPPEVWAILIQILLRWLDGKLAK